MSTKKGGIHYAWIILIGCCLLQAGQVGIILNVAGCFIQPVADALQCGRGEISLNITVTAWASAAMMPIVGRWLPTKNINVVMTGAAILTAGGMALMSQFTAPWMWWVDAAFIGVGAAFTFFASVPMILRNWFVKKTGLAIGIATACSGIGGAIFNPVITTLIAEIGWQNAYLVAGGLSAALTIPVTAFILKFKPADKGMTPYGAEEGVTVAAAAAQLKVGMSVKRAWSTGLVPVIVILAGCMSLSACMAQHMTGFGASVGFSATVLGLLGSMNMIGNLAGKLILAPVSDAIGPKRASTLGYAIVIIGFLMIIFNGGNAVIMFIGAILAGVASALLSAVLPLICGTMFGQVDYPKLFSYATIGNSLMGSLGTTITGAMYDISGTYYTGFAFVMVCAIVSLALIYFAMARAKKVGFDCPAEQETAAA